MSQFVPNTLAAIFRDGTVPDTTDAWGYPSPPGLTLDQADVKNLPALLTEYGQSGQSGSRTRQNAEGTAVVVHRYNLRLRPGAVDFEVTPQDRVLDQRAGIFYEVDEVPLPGSPVQAGDIRLVLRRVS